MHEQIVQRLDVFREQAHGVLSFRCGIAVI
jgi:hypothetical protein